MKGLFINGFEDIELKDNVPVPEISEGEALIRVKYVGICGSDLHHYRNHNAPISGVPTILGHEFVGTVVESKVKNARYRIGDFVTAIPYFSCNACDNCMNGRKSLCEKQVFMGVHTNGAYAEYVKVDGNHVFPFKKGVDPKIAALAEPLAVAVYDVKRSGVTPGSSVFISGGGPIGILIGIMAEFSGATNIVFSEINENRIEFIRGMGYNAFNPFQCDVVQEACSCNGKQKFDVVFEVSGAQSSYDAAFGVVKKGGKFMPVALTGTPRSISMFDVTRSQIEIIGVNLYEEIDFKRAVEIIGNGCCNEKLARLVTNVFPMDRAKEAYLYAGDPKGSHVKVLIENDQSM